MDGVLNIIKNDPWLEPYADAINGRHLYAVAKEKELVGKKKLSDFADGHLYFGLTKDGCSASGRRMLPTFTSSVISTAGKKPLPIK